MSTFPPPPPSFPAGGPAFPPPAGPAPGGSSSTSKSKKGRKARDSGTPTKRSLRRNRTFALVFAVIVALGFIVLVTRKTPERFAVQARVAVPAGKPIVASDLQATALPSAAIEPHTFNAGTAQAAIDYALKRIGKKTTVQALLPDEELQPDLFSSQQSVIHGRQRLMSIVADPAASVAGRIKVGDRVDIIAVSKAAGMAGYVATDVPIVGVAPNDNSLQNETSAGSSTGPAGASSSRLPGTYVIKTTQTQATKIAIAVTDSDAVYLTLRGKKSSDAPASKITPVTIEQALCGSLAGNQSAPATCAALPKG